MARSYSARPWRWKVGALDEQETIFKTHRWHPAVGFCFPHRAEAGNQK
jgi:hypothetical protein